jgi:hypothetical protein
MKYVTTSCFYQVPHKIIETTIVKMVNMDTSYKHMGWYGHDYFSDLEKKCQ